MPSKKRIFGDQGEYIALEYLEKKGMTLLQKNFLVRTGEIDLVMQDKKEVVFVEVKTRSSDAFGSASEAITPTKLQRIKKAIEQYFFSQEKNMYEESFRIDAICISLGKDQKNPEIEHFQNIGQF